MQQINQQRRRTKILSAAVGTSVVAALVSFAEGAQYVFTPAGTTDQWSAGTNWSATPVSAADTQLTIVGNNATVIPAAQASAANNDNGGNFQVNILDLQGTGPASGTAPTISLTGNSLELIVNGAINPVVNLNALTGPVGIGYTVGNNLVFTNNTTLAGNGNVGFTFSGAISGGGSLTKSGTSTALLTGSNNYGGGTTVGGGILRTAQAASLPGYNSSGVVVVSPGATLGVIAAGAGQWIDTEIAALLSNATFNSGSTLGVQVDTGNILSYTSNITNPIAISKTGSGTLILGGSNSHTGGTTISGGVLSVSDAANIAGGSSTVNFSGGVLQVTGTALTNLNGNTVNTANFNGGFDIADAGNSFTFSQSISGSGGLSKAGAGTLVLSGTNTHTGNTSLSNGTLVITNGSELGAGQLNLSNAAFPVTLQINGATATISNPTVMMDGNAGAPISINGASAATFTGVIKNSEANGVVNINNTGSTTFSGDIHLSDNSANRTFRFGGSGNVTLSGVVSNGTAGSPASQLTYQGTGTMTLTGTNTHTNRTNVTSGTVTFTNTSAFGTSQVWLGTTATSGTLLLPAGSLTLANQIVVDSSNTANTSGVIAGASAVNLTGALGNDDTNGRLEVNNTALTTFSGPVNLSTTNANRTLRVSGSGNVLFSGVVDEGPGGSTASSLTYQGTGTLTLSGANTHAGTTTVATGTVSITNSSQLGTARLDLGSNGVGSAVSTFAVTGSNVSIPNTTFIRGTTGTEASISAASPLTFSGQFSSATGTGVVNVNNTSLTTLAGPVMISDGTSNRTLRFGGSGNVLITGPLSNSPSTGIGSLVYQGTGMLTVSGAISHTGSTSATSGTLVLNNSLTTSSSLTASGAGTVELASDGSYLRVIKVPSLTVSGTGKVDLKDNKMIVGGAALGTWDGSVYTGVTGLVQSGRGDGTWNGSGIVTSNTDATTGVLTTLAVASAEELGNVGGTFAAETVNAGDTLVMYTWGGDADLNGELNGDDYFFIDSNAPANGSVFGFHQGDFDYNGTIDGDDYFIIDSNITFAQASPPFPVAAGGGGGLAAVPEPASLGLLSLTMILGSRRRRRGQRTCSLS